MKRKSVKKDYAHALNDLYGRGDLVSRVVEALEQAGVDSRHMAVDALGPLEELHIGGREQTLTLGRLAGLSEGAHVIDIGCGIGGPARGLAYHFGCRVTGIDLTEEFCTLARILTQRTGLEDKVEIHHGNALDLPFGDDAFDLAWMQHVALNIPDKAQLLSEIRRVLRPEGKIAIYEILAGEHAAVHLPVPWARDAALNLLVTEQELLEHLTSAGFRAEIWEDVTREATHFARRVVRRLTEYGLPPLSSAILLGPDYPLMMANLLKNLEEHRIKVSQAIVAPGPPG